MVNKFYAKRKMNTGQEVIINAFEGLELRDSAEIETSPKDKASLFDVETNLPVMPKSGKKQQSGKKQPYFSYYPNEDSPLRGQEGNFEYSSQLNTFLEAFKSIKKFKIEENGDIIEIFPKDIHRLKRIDTGNGNYVILKFLIELKYTVPYSVYYRYNGKLGLEIYYTSKPKPIKRVELGKMGIPIFEAKAVFPEYTENLVKEDFENLNSFEYAAKELRKTYEEKNYRLIGNFNKYNVENLIFLEDNERKYIELKTYEEQIEEYIKQKQELEEKIKELTVEEKTKEKKLDKLNSQIGQQRINLEKYCSMKTQLEKLVSENSQLKEKESLSNKKNKKQEEKIDNLEEKIKNLKNRTLWERILNRSI